MNGCKNCPAFAKCTVTYRGSACAVLRSTYGLDNDPEIPMTNADRIRAMSDEELAVFMSNEKYDTDDRYIVSAWWLKWLQQPCEGGADRE